MRLAAVLLLLALAPGWAVAGAVDLMAERLSLMQPVAAWKHGQDKPVEDIEREAVVIERSAAAAAAHGLDPATTTPFFAAQVEAAKAIQMCWIARWEAGEAEPPADPPDLITEIRPQLIDIGDRLLETIAGTLAGGESIAAEPGPIDVDCLPAAERDAVLEALGRIRRLE